MTINRATDTRPPFFSIEDAVVDQYQLGALAGWLYVVIVRHINRKTNEAFPSINRLAKLAGMSRASVMRNIKVLEEKKLIDVIRETNNETKEKQVNHYRLLPATRGVVSDRDQGSISEQLGVVSDVDYNQKNTNHIKEIAPAAQSAPPSKNVVPFKPRNHWYDAIFEVWGYTAGLNGNIEKMLRGRATKKPYKDYNLEMPLEESGEILEWRKWYIQVKCKGRDDTIIVSKLEKIQSSFGEWQIERLKGKAKATALDGLKIITADDSEVA